MNVPSVRRIVVFAIPLVLILLIVSFALQAELPAPTGDSAVGRITRHWVDPSRPEPLTASPDDSREVMVSIWYPAEAGTGVRTSYFPGLADVADGLRQSKELSILEVALLPLMRGHDRLDAHVSDAAAIYSVILLSPGGATNVEFYSGLADDLASHGYIVVGVNHPYDVAATTLSDGRVAVSEPGPFPIEQHQQFIADRMLERVADLRFVLDQLEILNGAESGELAGRLDLDHIAVMGHSLGGITAAMTCAQDTRLDACLNLDGIQAGGPFGTTANPDLPTQPFMFLTKEETLGANSLAMLEDLTGGSYLVTVHGASHDSFTDGPALLPSLLPLPNKADRIMDLTRSYVLAFMDQSLRGKPSLLLVPSDSARVSVRTLSPD